MQDILARVGYEPTMPQPLSKGDLEKSLKSILSGQPSSSSDSIWLFAYGSLIWNPEFEFREKRRAFLHGWSRRLCCWSREYRGTQDEPGLAFGLTEGGGCDGVAYRLSREQATAYLPSLWRREMRLGSYLPLWVNCVAAGETISAVAFIMNRKSVNFIDGLSLEEQATIVRSAVGKNGRCSEYFTSTIDLLKSIEITDAELNLIRGMLINENHE